MLSYANFWKSVLGSRIISLVNVQYDKRSLNALKRLLNAKASKCPNSKNGTFFACKNTRENQDDDSLSYPSFGEAFRGAHSLLFCPECSKSSIRGSKSAS